MQDFELIRVVGKGTFGKVFQVQHKRTGRFYAMKCIRKDVILKSENMQSITLEKEILDEVDHPFSLAVGHGTKIFDHAQTQGVYRPVVSDGCDYGHGYERYR